jgi:glutathione S-transferase
MNPEAKPMTIYFSPLACSLASRIAVYEAGAEARFLQVDTKTQRTEDGVDYRTIHALGLVPALVLDDGSLLTENAAILEHIAERFPAAGLLPEGALGRTRVRQMLSFVGTELHKALYVPLLDKKAPEQVKAYALAKMPSRLAWLSSQLEGKEYAVGGFSVADAYLYAVLNWSMVTPVDLSKYPVIKEYQGRVGRRATVAKAFSEERFLYGKELLYHAVQAVIG